MMGPIKANHAFEYSPPPCLLRLGRREIDFLADSKSAFSIDI